MRQLLAADVLLTFEVLPMQKVLAHRVYLGQARFKAERHGEDFPQISGALDRWKLSPMGGGRSFVTS